MKISKNRKNLINNFDTEKSYDAIEAIRLLKQNTYAKFEETLDVAVNLGIDPNKTEQNVRGVINLPKGTGKNIKVVISGETKTTQN